MTINTPPEKNWKTKIVGALKRAFALFLWVQGLAGATAGRVTGADAFLLLVGIAGAIACFRFAATSAFEKASTRPSACLRFLRVLAFPGAFVALCAIALDAGNPFAGSIHLACAIFVMLIAGLCYGPIFLWRLRKLKRFST